MLNKAQGVPIENMVEYERINPSSFGANVTDQWVYEAQQDGTPARPSHSHDTTAYASASTYDSWQAKLAGWQASPARAGSSNWNMSRGIVP